METTNQSALEVAVTRKDSKVVDVELNGVSKSIARGEYIGRTLKLALDVPLEYELDRVIKGEFRPIPNDEKVHVKDGEKFVSHCGQGQSS